MLGTVSGQVPAADASGAHVTRAPASAAPIPAAAALLIKVPRLERSRSLWSIASPPPPCEQRNRRTRTVVVGFTLAPRSPGDQEGHGMRRARGSWHPRHECALLLDATIASYRSSCQWFAHRTIDRRCVLRPRSFRRGRGTQRSVAGLLRLDGASPAV